MMTDQDQTADNAKKYIVGIDLGTTHTVVSYSLKPNRTATFSDVKLFEIDQLIGPGKVAKQALLPSFRYHPAKGEIAQEVCELPWQHQSIEGDIEQVVIGYWARELGSKTAGRLVSSAKSWLSHAGVDREANLLPLIQDEDTESNIARVSPVVASASYLNYVKQAWDHHFPLTPLAKQQIIITLPASFDEVARNLTCKAAALAGLTHFHLLEEPQAACYDWQHQQSTSIEITAENSNQTPIKNILVCDIGGGTTDLSLIQLSKDKENKSTLTRTGVGKHLLLGGDNLDLALARQAEQTLSPSASSKKPLKPSQINQLIQQCRQAKETLLSTHAPDSATVTLLGSGSSLLGGAKHCKLEREDAQSLILNGFFPQVSFDVDCKIRKAAMLSLGLPFDPEPAITKHIAQFLNAHKASLKPDAVPDSVLLNGGVFNSEAIRKATIDSLSNWRGLPIHVLHNPHPNLSVSIGAVYYGMALNGLESKIEGGASRNYFLRLDNGKCICLLTKGSQEGETYHLNDRKFNLKTGSPVRINMLTTEGEEKYQAGKLYSLDHDSSYSLPPLITVLDQNEDEKQHVQVSLSAQYTTLGTLDIVCHNYDDSNQTWHLAFDLRQANTESNTSEPQTKTSHSRHPRWEEAESLVQKVYGTQANKEDAAAIKVFRNQLEKTLGPRATWNANLLRQVCDLLLSLRAQRKRSNQHERIWLNLTGFCLRPGFGHPADKWRIEQLWPLYANKLYFNKDNSSWTEWWTFWRRLAGGLSDIQQQLIFKDINKYIQPAALRNRKLQADLKSLAFDDMLKLAGSLEKLPIDAKQSLGDAFASRLKKQSNQPTMTWALGRTGSREPFHGSLHQILAPTRIQNWINLLLNGDWKKYPYQGFAVVMMAKNTGDELRDIDKGLQDKIANKLRSSKLPEMWSKIIQEVVQMEESEKQRMYGESLPSGIQLIE